MIINSRNTSVVNLSLVFLLLVNKNTTYLSKLGSIWKWKISSNHNLEFLLYSSCCKFSSLVINFNSDVYDWQVVGFPEWRYFIHKARLTDVRKYSQSYIQTESASENKTKCLFTPIQAQSNY